jgi:D-alanyl-D-alanine carboxypeptidase
MGWNSYDLDPSFDLYGAGGIAATSKDLALFSQALFEGEIIKSPQVLDLIYTKIDIKEGDDPHYFMGLQDSEIAGRPAYGHGGFWGTVVQYIPELNTSISVFVLERDHRILRAGILETMIQLLDSERKKQLRSKI